MILFIQMGTDGLVHIVSTPSMRAYLDNIRTLNPEPLHLIGHMQSRSGLIARVKQRFIAARVDDQWYRPSPELMAYILEGDKAARPGTNRRRLTTQETLEIYRLSHTSDMTDAEIGAKYGVSAVAVGNVARGMVRTHLFNHRITSGSTYYVSERVAGAPEYHMRHGKRSR